MCINNWQIYKGKDLIKTNQQQFLLRDLLVYDLTFNITSMLLPCHKAKEILDKSMSFLLRNTYNTSTIQRKNKFIMNKSSRMKLIGFW